MQFHGRKPICFANKARPLRRKASLVTPGGVRARTERGIENGTNPEDRHEGLRGTAWCVCGGHSDIGSSGDHSNCHRPLTGCVWLPARAVLLCLGRRTQWHLCFPHFLQSSLSPSKSCRCSFRTTQTPATALALGSGPGLSHEARLPLGGWASQPALPRLLSALSSPASSLQ